MKSLARAEDRAQIRHRLETVHPGSARRWGTMSAHQMICHLSDGYRMAMGQLPVTSATGPLQRTLWKWVALYLPWPWPAGIPTRPEIDQQCDGTRPSDFAGDVADLARLLDLFATDPHVDDGPAHPIFGRMSRSAWLRWGYLHADHHLRQFGA